jgi:hypothetical protein
MKTIEPYIIDSLGYAEALGEEIRCAIEALDFMYGHSNDQELASLQGRLNTIKHSVNTIIVNLEVIRVESE